MSTGFYLQQGTGSGGSQQSQPHSIWGNFGEYIHNMTTSPEMMDAGNDIAIGVIRIAIYLTGTFIVVVGVLDGFKAAQGESPDFDNFKRGLLMFVLLFFYPDIIQRLGDLVQGITMMISDIIPKEDVFEKMSEGQVEQYHGTNPGSAITDPVVNVGEFLIFGTNSEEMTREVIGWGKISQKVIFFVRELLLMLLYIAGPLTLFLSIFGFLKDSAQKWLVTFLNVHLWSVTMALINCLAYYYITGSDDALQMGSLATAIAIMLLYLFTPFITSLWFKQSGAGGLIGKMMGAAAIGVMMGGKLAGGAQKMAGGTSSAAPSSSLPSDHPATGGGGQGGGSEGPTPAGAGGGSGPSVGGGGQPMQPREPEE